MTRPCLLLGSVLVLSAFACGGQSVDGPTEIEHTADALRTRTNPIAQVAQYAGSFKALDVRHGDFELKNDGTFVWSKGQSNERMTGNYVGPKKPNVRSTTVKLAAPKFTAEVSEEWTAAEGARAVLKIKLETGETIALASKYHLAGEAECDDSHGHYTDDDLDPATGLNCLCDAPKVFRHAANGCR